MTENNIQTEIDQNFEAFEAQLPSIIKSHRGKFALMHNKEIVSYYSTWEDARTTGEKFFSGVYSVQEVTDQPEDLGFFSHAVNFR